MHRESSSKPNTQMQTIATEAAQLFFEKGFHVATMEDLAGSVGILKGSLYYYIRSKEQLLYGLLIEVVERADQLIAGTIASKRDPCEQLRGALEKQVEYMIDNRVRVGLFLHEFRSLSRRRRLVLQTVIQRNEERFVTLIRRGQQTGSFVDGDARIIALGLLGACNWIYRWHDAAVNKPMEVKQEIVGLLMRCVLVAPREQCHTSRNS